ncbi:hypothetical protein [Thioalkalivibrio thiocyanodenitrificans]|uniref:hypothetical protein n=1 Tax=Thioalkalivibrio thiocyanodenitrificans TaxID=243063 RepID=UPI00037B4064|nr:hypothetical protein [Thioalkalivibrio thiocyanodenitrificans]
MQYVVMNENTLGIIRESSPQALEVLAGSVLKGGHDPKNGMVAVSMRPGALRPATKADFEAFRVSAKGHLE